MKIIYFADISRSDVVEAVELFKDFAKGKVDILANCFGDGCSSEYDEADIAVVFGGDGSILHAAHSLLGKDIPVAGINMGRLGFLAEFNIDDLQTYFDKIFLGDFIVEEKLLLDCTVRCLKGGVVKATALNDIAINSGPPFTTIELEIEVNSNPVTSCLGDGVVVCTPTGSTAYNLSAGGPIISTDVEAIGITPLNPHSLSFRPVVVNPKKVIEIFPVRVNAGSAITVDGRILANLEDAIGIKIEKSKEKLKLISNPNKTQWDALACKLKWAQKPHYKADKTDCR